jgi:hypothetical protein
MPNIRAESPSPLHAAPTEVTQTWGERIGGGYNLPENEIWDRVFRVHYGVVDQYSFATSIFEVQHPNNFAFTFAIADHAHQTFQTSYWRFSTTSNNTTRHYLDCVLTLANNYLRSNRSKERLITTVQEGVDVVTLEDLEDIDFEDTHPDLYPY